MKQYNFDEIINRRGTNCVKYDGLKEAFGNADLTPLWVADMDFATPDFIIDALKKRCEHPVFGYTFASEAYYRAIIEWVKKLPFLKKEWKHETLRDVVIMLLALAATIILVAFVGISLGICTGIAQALSYIIIVWCVQKVVGQEVLHKAVKRKVDAA